MVLVATPLLVVSCAHAVRYVPISVPEYRPAWVKSCAAALEDAHKQVAAQVPGAAQPAAWERGRRPQHFPADCVAEYETEIELAPFVEQSPKPAFRYEVSFSTFHERGNQAADWKEEDSGRKRTWSREEPRSAASISVEPAEFPQRDFVVNTFRRALDSCIAAVPVPARPQPPTAPELDVTCAAAPKKAVCIDAERAAWDLEHLCRVESDCLGFGCKPGRTIRALEEIVVLGGDATPILLRLARSANPAGRAVAAVGLGHLRTPVALEALRRLAQDREPVGLMDGDSGRLQRVGSFAEGVLDGLR